MKPDQACSRELKGVLQQPEGRLDTRGRQRGSENTKSFVLQKLSLLLGCGVSEYMMNHVSSSEEPNRSAVCAAARRPGPSSDAAASFAPSTGAFQTKQKRKSHLLLDWLNWTLSATCCLSAHHLRLRQPERVEINNQTGSTMTHSSKVLV